MSYIKLGKTGLMVERLGFGGIPIQRVDEDQAIETVLHVVEAGANFIDTARAYTTSEQRIGMALQKTRKKVIVASKSQEKTAEGIRQDLEKSFSALQLDYIDIYQCHNVAKFFDYERIVASGGALEGLVKAKEEGLIGHYGVSSHSLDVLDRALDDGLFETIMLCFSFLESKARERIIPKALERNVGVIAMKPFSGGFIDNANLALKYVLSQPGIAVVAGVEHKDLFAENWKIFQEGAQLTDDEKQQIEEIRKCYDKSFCRRCDYCQPCPEEIPIQIILGLRAAVKKLGKIFLQTGWRRDAIEKARNCSECGQCMSRCPYELPIPDLIKDNLQWVDEQLKSL
jgi:predicted aldo/keto reductase-like oxidoreductase